MKVVFFRRGDYLLMPDLALAYTIGPYSWSVFGGPKQAEIEAIGEENDLWQLLDYIRCPVRIYSDMGEPVWWGYVSEVQLEVGRWNAGITMDSMANYVGVAYQDDANSGTPDKTAWAQNDDSVAEFGRKEMLFTSSASNLTHALYARDKFLSEKKYPVPILNPGGMGGNKATIYCQGWFDSLSWRYYSHAYGKETYEDDGTGAQSFGNGGSTQKLAQAFKVDETLQITTACLGLKKVGTVADNLVAKIYSDSGGVPNTLLATSDTVAGNTLGDYLGWTSFTFTGAAQVSLTAASTYWLEISRTGAQDGSNYYQANVNEALGYGDGAFKIWNGGAWVDRSPNADMLFKVLLGSDTATQIQAMAVSCGEFFDEVIVEVASGLITSPYRDGNSNGHYEIKELLEMGTINKRRMLCEVTQDLNLRVYEEPAEGSYKLILKNGKMTDEYGAELRKELCTVGAWARIKDVIPPSVDTTQMADPSVMFIDEAEYDPRTDQLVMTPRGYIDPFKIGVPKNG